MPFPHPARLVPRWAFSRLMGMVSHTPLPVSIREPALGRFAERFGIDLEPIEKNLKDYKSLDDFFVRRLKPGARPIDDDPQSVVCPCDGAWQGSGSVEKGRILQVKGIDYSLTELLHAPELAQAFEGGSFVTIYLSPKDYHRVHFPLSVTVESVRSIAGERYPVGLGFDRMIPSLFARNARMVFRCRKDGKPFVLVMVAAMAVSDIECCVPEEGESHEVQKGDEAGVFHLGSTVVMLFPPKCRIEAPEEGSPVQLGQKIGLWSVED